MNNLYLSNLVDRLKEWLPFIGNPRFLQGTRTTKCQDLGAGCRASKVLSGGGALCDVGWHLIDTILGLLESSSTPKVSHADLITTRCHQQYDAEDTAFVSLLISPHEDELGLGMIPCNLVISRIGDRKIDELVITGTDGVLFADSNSVRLQFFLGTREKQMEWNTATDNTFGTMLRAFHTEICRASPSERYRHLAKQDILVTRTFDDIYGGRFTYEGATHGPSCW